MPFRENFFVRAAGPVFPSPSCNTLGAVRCFRGPGACRRPGGPLLALLVNRRMCLIDKTFSRLRGRSDFPFVTTGVLSMQRLAGAGLMLLAMLVAGVAMAAAETKQPRPIYGTAEEVFIPELGIRVPAKVDTGAESASLSAIHVRRFKRNDERWVRFQLAVEGLPAAEIELPLSHNVRIRRRASDFEEGEDKDYARRPVIELTLCIGDRKQTLNVNLADRRRFSQPMLIGRDALRALHAMVDVEQKFAVGEPRCDGVDSARRATIEKD